ncbi:MAG: putative porin [Elusimicrobiota bacterium]|jgi:hypothetical protein|nr:putative porin [Elusimicrobiota bacterium]
MQKVLMLIAVMLLSVFSVFAGEVDKLTSILADKGIISYGEAQRIISETKEDSRQQTASGTNEVLPKWIQNLTFKGDIRIRHQVDWDNSKGATAHTRQRERLRLRFGFETRPIENLKTAFGLASGAFAGNGDKSSTSTNHTFQAFDKAPIFIDYAYIQYEFMDYFKLTGGKMKSGTQVWNPSDLIWDTDINPDGFALNFNRTLNSKLKVFANASWLILNEVNDNTSGSMPDVYSIQPGISFETGNVKIKAALSYQQFNMKGRTIYSNEDKYLITTKTTGTGDSNYQILNPSLEIKLSNVIENLSISLFSDYVQNLYDKVYKNNLGGYLFGIGFGNEKLEKFGAWQIKFMHRYLERNAIPLGLGDSDAYGGAGNAQGQEVIFNFGLAKNLYFGVDYYSMEQIEAVNGKSKVPKSVVQLDLNYKF